MRLDFIPNPAQPTLRLFEWADDQPALLAQVAITLADGIQSSVQIDQLPFVRAEGITFTWTADPWDRGVLMPEDGTSFVMQLPREQWRDVAEAIRRVCGRSTNCFEYLLPVTHVEVLMSQTGGW